MERKDINKNETWDLSLIYNNNELFYKDLELAKDLLNKLSNQKDDFLNSKENFLKFHEDYTYLLRIANKLYCFSHLNCDVEPTNQDYQTMNSSVLTFFNELLLPLAVSIGFTAPSPTLIIIFIFNTFINFPATGFTLPPFIAFSKVSNEA